MFIYATSNFASCVFVIATVSSLYNIAGITSLVHIPFCFCQHVFCHKSLQTLSSTHSIPLALFPSLLYLTTSMYFRPKIFEIVHLYQLCCLQHHLPTALSLMYLFICLFSYYHNIIYILLYVLHLIPNDI